MGAGATLILDPAQTLAMAEALPGLSILQENWSLTPGTQVCTWRCLNPGWAALINAHPPLFTAWEKLRSKPHNWLT